MMIKVSIDGTNLHSVDHQVDLHFSFESNILAIHPSFDLPKIVVNAYLNMHPIPCPTNLESSKHKHTHEELRAMLTHMGWDGC